LSPVAHTAFGVWLGDITLNDLKLKSLIFYALIASLPDFDLVFGYLFYGKQGLRYHQLFTHNIIFVIVITFLFYILSRKTKTTIFVFLALISHLILDLLVTDTSPPIGIKLFYPFSEKAFNFPLVSGVDKSSIKAFFSLNNLKTIIVEFTIFLPFILLIIIKNKITNKNQKNK